MVVLGEKSANITFNHELIEAINNAVTFGLDVPGPHEDNDKIGRVTAAKCLESSSIPEFVSALKSYIDTYHYDSNKQLCEKHHLDKAYFHPNVQSSKEQILDIISCEQNVRSSDTLGCIHKYRMLSAQMAVACLEIVKDDSYNT